jgi:hypothetical protein
MGRIPILTKISSEISIENSRQNQWLVTYSFSGSKPNPHFFNKIVELTSNLVREGAYFDKSPTSIFMTNDLHGAIIAVKLAKRYGAKVLLYKVEEIDQNLSVEPDFEFKIEKDEVSCVRKAVYSILKGLSKEIVRFDDDVTELVIFLWVTEYMMRPNLPLKKVDLENILEKIKYLEEPKKVYDSKISFSFDYDNIGPIMKAIKKYVMKNKGSSTRDVSILFNILKRFTNISDDPIIYSVRQPLDPTFSHSLETMIDMEMPILDLQVDDLVEKIKKARIVQEII